MTNSLLPVRSYNFYDRVLRKLRLIPVLKVFKDTNNCTWVSDGKKSLAIVHPDRATRYRHGIKRRCRKMSLRRYLCGGRIKIRPGDVVINIGANIGEVTAYLLEQGAKVFAIEPDPVAIRCLELNTQKSDIKIIPYGVWKEDGELKFYLATEDADSSLVNPSKDEIKVEVKTLDTICREEGIENIRLILGDAEGAEPEVLQGAVNALKIAEYVCLDCSYERQGEQTRDACSAILVSAGFDIIKSGSRKHLAAKRKT